MKMKFYCNLNTAKIFLNCWSLGEESIRYPNLLEISHEKEIIQILEMGLTYVGGKKHKLKHSFVLLSALHDLEVLIAECEKTMSYQVSQR